MTAPILTYDCHRHAVAIAGDHICASTEYAFTRGQCHALAYVAAKHLDCEVFVARYPTTHVMVALGDNLYADIKGLMDENEMLERWGLELMGDDCKPYYRIEAEHMSADDMLTYSQSSGYTDPDLKAAELVLPLVLERWGRN